MTKEVSPADCLECRLVSGFGIIGVGANVYAQAKKRRKIEMNAMKVLSAGIVGLGVARLLNMDFLKAKKKG